MKKFLLVAIALVFAMTINAQQYEVGYADDEEWEAIAGDPDITPLFHDGDFITWRAAFADEWKVGSAGACVVNDDIEVRGSNTGAVGSNNPTREDIITVVAPGDTVVVSQGALTGCAAFEFVPKQCDGYLYIFSKPSTNKQYVAYEEGWRIPYSFGAYRDGSTWSYNLLDIPEALKYDEDAGDYYISDTYTIDYCGVYTGDSYDESTGAVSSATITVAVIKFPVYLGCKYQFCGLGTKVPVSAYYFDTTGDATIVTSDGGTIYKDGVAQGTTRFPADPTGIQSTVVEETTSSSAAYNLAGQRVSKDTKGVVIIDGKKFIIK